MKKQNEKLLTYVTLFSSAGVGCYGLKEKGFTCVATAELSQKRIDIQKFNKKCASDDGYICGDLSTDETKNRLFDVCTSFFKKGQTSELDLLIATPPCQGMSVANHKKKNELKRNSLIIESLAITLKLMPKFFVFENVSAFLKSICTDFDGHDKTIHRAIESNLSSKYFISYNVVNFKNYGSNSSRTRTLVIGVRKDINDVLPLDLMPDYVEEKMLVDVIGNMKPLNTMGEIDPEDIYHSFRPYKENMRLWIKNIKEGQSAFDNDIESEKPHQIINGKIVVNQNKNGDKYKRQMWSKVAPCVHTRNDILASQNTVHPVDDRVFSIRELMNMMTIPRDFKWSKFSIAELNSKSIEEKRIFLKQNELTIRQCIGEAVPTAIFTKIAEKIKTALENINVISDKDIYKIIDDNCLLNSANLLSFIKVNIEAYGLQDLFKIAELANHRRADNAAYYTRQDVCYSLVKDLPSFDSKDTVLVLEPAVGVGNFLPLVAKKYASKKCVHIDAFDIDETSIEICKILLKKMNLGNNIKVNFINADFLEYEMSTKYDIAIGNPPYKKIINNKAKLNSYKKKSLNMDTNNIFAFFIEKCTHIADFTALIVPKSFLSAPEYQKTRAILEKISIQKIVDYGEKAFDVKIETIGFIVQNKKIKSNQIVEIESYILGKIIFQNQNYITSNQFGSWLLYRNDFFDLISQQLLFGVFDVYRDRQITKKILQDSGQIRVIKSRNIIDNGVVNLENYDKYIDSVEMLGVGKFLNMDNIVLVPNLTYNPRASFLPKNSIADGSVALLIPKAKVTKKDLNYFSSSEFREFYKIARNYGSRSLNIDSNSVKFFGIRKAPINLPILAENPRETGLELFA